jgi:Metallo-beta-lactamase superfamily
MTSVPEFHALRPDLFLWHAYDPKAKAELFSSAIRTAAGLLLVDPIPPASSVLAELQQAGPLAGVVVTNNNHWRASAELSARFALPLFAHPETYPGEKPPRFNPVANGGRILGHMEVVQIAGAVAGEVALHATNGGGTLVMGDALINFEPYGFTFLPGKYCSNEKEMRDSLRQLLHRKTERMLFAHGTPILGRAGARLAALLGSDA